MEDDDHSAVARPAMSVDFVRGGDMSQTTGTRHLGRGARHCVAFPDVAQVHVRRVRAGLDITQVPVETELAASGFGHELRG